jgi:exodeoxyribonuclease V alpha subunit
MTDPKQHLSLENLLSTDPLFSGIGPKLANKIVTAHPNLAHLLATKSAILTYTLSAKKATTLFAQYQHYLDALAFEKLLLQKRLPKQTAHTLSRAWGKTGHLQFERNPFALASWLSWNDTNTIRTSLGMYEDTPDYLIACVEHAFQQVTDANHTWASYETLSDILSSFISHHLIHKALKHAWDRTIIVDTHKGYQLLSISVMEKTIADRVTTRITLPKTAITSSFLTQEQIQAVNTILSSSFSLTNGGAGSGKTTLLKTLLSQGRGYKNRIFLVALAGKAARRIEETTSHKAYTIAGFLLKSKKLNLTSDDLVIIDEASMVSLPDLYKVLRTSRTASIALIGDEEQLPPIGFGKPFHDLLCVPSLPKTNLSQIHRQALQSPVLHLANAIRHKTIPDLSQNKIEHGNVSYIDCPLENIPSLALAFHKKFTDQGQILTPVHKTPSGAINLNTWIATSLYGQDAIQEAEGLPVGMPVMATETIGHINVSNGSIGVIKPNNTLYIEQAYIPLTPYIKSVLIPAYAITVHKSQGSQWPFVFLSLAQTSLLERSLLYTAVTRSEKGLVIAGPKHLLDKAIMTPSKHTTIQTALPHHIQDILS